MKILILGYYDRANLGDEMFKMAFTKILPNSVLTFLCIDDCKAVMFDQASTNFEINEYDCVICGGGDIVNDYFYFNLRRILKGFPGPIFAVGVGIPYYGLIKKGYLDIYDHVFIREQSDLRRIQRRLGSEYAHYLPDLGFSLSVPDIVMKNRNNTKYLGSSPDAPERKYKIGVFLAQSLFKHKAVLYSIVSLIRKLTVDDGHIVIMYRFNTSGSEQEDDKGFNTFIYESISKETNNIKIDDNVYDVNEMMMVMSMLDVGICMRFHSHIFATMSNLPFLSIYSTRKVQLYIKDIEFEQWSCPIDLTNDGKPSGLDWDEAYNIFYKVVKDSYIIREKEKYITDKYSFLHDSNKIENLLRHGNNCRPKQLDQIEKVDVVSIYNECADILKNRSLYDPREDKVEDRNIIDINIDVGREVATVLCYRITGMPSSTYLYGTILNVMSKPWDLKEMIKWIYKDFMVKYYTSNKLINLDIYSQNAFKGLHRSGWQYVINHMEIFNCNNGVILDMYLDLSFLWGKWILKRQGILPYTSPWIGFIHHCPIESYTVNNTVELIKDPDFQRSLSVCKGIICLTDYLSNWFKERLPERDFPIITLRHPTIFPKLTFNPDSFLENPTKKIINIGAWYRNPFTIHRLNNNNTEFKKCSLKGREMNNYFKPEEFKFKKKDIVENGENNKWCYYLFDYLNTLSLDNLSDNDVFNISDDAISSDAPDPNLSEYGKAMWLHIKDLVKSVEIIEYLPNDEYDKIFTENVIFLDLVDASAANTIIESIVRNTPLIIRKISPVVEYLGADYPLYYETPEDVHKILDVDKILEGHNYLMAKDKDFLKIEHFIEEFQNEVKDLVINTQI